MMIRFTFICTLLILQQQIYSSLTIHDKYLLPRIIQQPASQISQSGSKVVFKCDYDTIDTLTLTSTLAISSYIQIKWLFNLQFIENSNVDYVFDKNRMIIPYFNEYKHTGEYRCLINNTLISWSILSEPANLSLAFIDEIQQEKSNEVQLSISEGNVAIISCKLPESNPPAVPLFVLNNTIVIDNEIPRYKIFPSGNLQISNVKFTDSGVYTCSARNPITNEIRNNTKRTVLNIFEPAKSQAPSIIYSPIDANRVAIGSNLTLECVANGAPVPVITWEKFGGSLPEKRATQLFGNLILTNIQQEDRGTYVCRADNGPGQATFKTAMIDVFEAPTLLNLNDGITNTLSSQIVKYYANRNDNIELKCPIRSRPKSEIQWFFNGRLLTANQRSSYSITDRSLLIKNVNQQLIGAYQCFARNEYGFKQAQIVLYLKEDIQQIDDSLAQQLPIASQESPLSAAIVTNLPPSDATLYGPKPTILIGPQNLTIFEGQTVVLLCVTEANAQINWLQNDIIIEPSLMRRFEINQVGNLRIVSAQKSDTGVYKCIASNEFGMSYAEGHVTVKDDETAASNTRKGTNTDFVNSDAPIKSGKGKKSNKHYPVAARPQTEQIDFDKVLLKWGIITPQQVDKAIDNDEAIDYFKIEYKTTTNKKQDWITIDEKIDAGKREYILTDLSPAEHYRFRLSCFYKNGHQLSSQQSPRFKLAEAGKFSATKGTSNNNSTQSNEQLIELQIQQVWALSDTSLALKWQLFNNELDTTPTLNNTTKQLIDGFYIYYRKLSTQEMLNFEKQSQNETPLENYQLIKIPNSQMHLVDTYIITNLDASSTYEIKMACFTQAGKLVCELSNVVYGLTLNKSQVPQDIAAQLPQQFQTLLSSTTKPTTLANENQNQKQNEILFMVLGIILGVLSLLLGIFIMMCVIRHKQHKRLLIKLNTSQKLNGGSSCPTLIYDDCMRNINQNNKLSAATNANNLLSEALNGLTTLGGNNANLLNLLNQNSTTTFNNTQTTLLSSLSSGGTTSSLQQPPPIPSVPPPQITSTLNRNINLNVNPIGYLDANTLNFLKQQHQQQQQQQQQQQENFYHTLNMNNNTGTLQMHHFNPNINEYTNATLNLRAQLLLKQNPIIIEALNNAQQQQQRSSCLASPAMSGVEHEQHSTNSMTPKKRTRKRNSSNSSKQKKYEKIYQAQILNANEQEHLQIQFLQQLQQQQLEQEQQNMLLFSSILNNNENNQQKVLLLNNNNNNSNNRAGFLQYTSMSPTTSKYLNSNDLVLQTALNSQQSSGIGSTATNSSGDSINEELMPFLFPNSNQNSDNNNQMLENNRDETQSDYKRLTISS